MVWHIISWVGVCILTGVNLWVFWKFKKMTEQMLKNLVPGFQWSDLGPLMSQAQQWMQPGMGKGGMEGQMKAAMQLFSQLQQQKKK